MDPPPASESNEAESEYNNDPFESPEESVSFVRPTSAIQIAPTEESLSSGNMPNSELDPMMFIQLGDRIYMECQYGKIDGTVYYRSLELIRVRPMGVSNTLYHFEMEQTDEGEAFKEEDIGVQIIQKRKKESFVEQNDIRVKQVIVAFDKEGQRYQLYRVTDVNVDLDTFTIHPVKRKDERDEEKGDGDHEDYEEEDEEAIVVECNFIGIPADLPFVAISIVSEPPSAADWNETEVSSEPLEEEDLVPEDDEGIEFVGTMRVALSNVFEEAESYEQRIPDNMQRIDALNDFLEGVSPSLKKDRITLRNMRVLVDTLYHLQKLTMEYNSRGAIQGPAEVSVTTLVDLIERAVVPLGRPVLRMTKKEYLVDEDVDERQDTDEVRFQDFEKELAMMGAMSSKVVSSVMHGAKDESASKEWNDMRRFLEQYASPWSSLPKQKPMWSAMSDSDVFRTSPPQSADDDPSLFELPGYVPPLKGDSNPIFYRIPFGMERALSTTYRKGKDRRKEALVSEEQAPLQSYLLFPLSAANAMGSTRSSMLALDSGRSQLIPQTMKTILREKGAPKSTDATDDVMNDILLLDVAGNSLGNITLSSYIQGLTLPCLGLGDTMPFLRQYGLDTMEWNEQLYETLLRKVERYQIQLLSTLQRLRTVLETSNAPPAETNPLLNNPVFLANIMSQPLLANGVKEYTDSNLTLGEYDVGKVSYLMKKHPNYFQVAAGMDSKRIQIAFHHAARSEYYQQLKINHIISENERNAGIIPLRNSCKHVADLVTTRRIRDDSDRFREFTKIFRSYQGKRNGNWIDCNVCTKHFVCLHERLQLQAYLHPKEKDVIEKELILSFSGGQFQGKYICRNCGQPMRELDFDNNMQFDEEGRPISGNAELIDKDAEWNNVIDDMIDNSLGPDIEPSPQEEMKLNANEQSCYDIIKEISEAVGVFLDKKGYRNVITASVEWTSRFADRDTYLRRPQPKDGSKIDYEVAVARDKIAACGVFLLLEIQTHIPSYVVRYQLTGCKSPGFEGYPLDTDDSNKQGIEYLACAISTIRKKAGTEWSHGFQGISVDTIRLKLITSYFTKIMEYYFRNNDVIQAKLAEKRRYLKETLGQSSDGEQMTAIDMIPHTFLPEQKTLTAEEAAKDVIQADVAAKMGQRGAHALAKLWIRQAHAAARQTANIVKGIPYSETSCCMNRLVEPGAFWKTQSELPALSGRSMNPNQQGTFLLTEFHPREAEQLNETRGDANKDLYYRLFLKYCYEGERIGHPHQPGLTNLCMWCGFQFPTHPAVMDVNKEGKDALADVDTTTERFVDLLDTIHIVNRVPSLRLPESSGMDKIMEEFSNVQPVPIEDWKRLVQFTLAELKKITYLKKTGELEEGDRQQIAVAASELSDASRTCKDDILQRLVSDKYKVILENIASLSWTDFFNVLQSYFIIPFQRIISNFSGDNLKVSRELQNELSVTHVEQFLMPMLKKEINFLEPHRGASQSPSLRLARSKLRYYNAQLSALLPFMNNIRSSKVPGRELLLEYIQQAILYGPISQLLNSSFDPDEGEYSSSESRHNTSLDFLLELISHQLRKYKDESLAFDDERIKYLIAVRNEKERVNIIREFNGLTDEQREVELMNKRLGLGKWAVGGTKVIYAYDADYWDEERTKRLDAGIFDFPGSGDGQVEGLGGHEVDELGFRVYGDEEMERDGGYDHGQLNADDA